MKIKSDNLGFDESSKTLPFLTNRLQSVILQGCSSDEITVLRGVTPETVLEPLLFNLYISDMAKRFGKETILIQYTHDTVILIFDISIVESKAKLEQNANKLIQNVHEQQLTGNTSKTEFMILDKS